MMGLFVAVLFGMAGCGGGSSNSAQHNEITEANAGPVQNVVAGSLVTLNGSQSIGAAGSLITYEWSITTKPVGSAATIINPTTVNPTFVPDLPGRYTIKLVITDTKAVTSEATVTITASVANSAPMANAGTVQSVVTGTVVTLDGSASSDANGDLLTYSWAFTSKPAGSSAALSSATVPKPTFIADVAGAYVLNLVVNDGKVNSAAVAVTITAAVANAAPVANAGIAQSVVTGTVVTLDGSTSSDANGDLLTYSWAFTSKPAGSSAALSSATVPKPTFTTDVTGDYVLNLVVNDGKINSAAVTVIITASDANAFSLNQRFTIKVGQEASIPGEGLTLALQSVSEDSRCPEDAACVWEGNAKVSLNITKAGQTATTIELNTRPIVGPSEKTFQAYTVKLMSLAPNNKAGQTINSSDYIVSLLVTKN